MDREVISELMTGFSAGPETTAARGA